MRIKDFVEDKSLSGDEFLLGSDTDIGGKTRNYKLRDVALYVLSGMDVEGIDQDNLVVYKDIGNLGPNRTVATAVNELAEFQIREKEIYIFKCFKEEESEQNLGGTQGNKSEGVRDTPPIPLNYTNYTYIFRRGKGFYGAPIENNTEEVEESDFVLLSEQTNSLPGSESIKPILHVVPNDAGRSAHSAITSSSASYVISQDAIIYFQVGNVSGSGTTAVYRFVGDPGTYGFNGRSVSADDLINLSGTSATYTNNILIKEFDPILLQNADKASAVNALPPFDIGKDELAVFNFRRLIEGTRFEISTWMLKTGKGRYGRIELGVLNASRKRVRNTDFLLINRRETINVITPEGGVDPNKVEFEDVSGAQGSNIVEKINNSDEPIRITKGEFTTFLEDYNDLFQFVGEDGLYGKVYKNCSEDDLKKLEETVGPSEEDIKASLLEDNNVFEGHNTFVSVELTDSDKGLIELVDKMPSNTIFLNQGRLVFKQGKEFFEVELTPIRL